MLASASEVVGLTIGMFGLLFRECLLCQPQAEVQEATKLIDVHEQNIFVFWATTPLLSWVSDWEWNETEMMTNNHKYSVKALQSHYTIHISTVKMWEMISSKYHDEDGVGAQVSGTEVISPGQREWEWYWWWLSRWWWWCCWRWCLHWQVRTCDEWLVFLEPDEEAGGTTRVGRWNPVNQVVQFAREI